MWKRRDVGKKDKRQVKTQSNFKNFTQIIWRLFWGVGGQGSARAGSRRSLKKEGQVSKVNQGKVGQETMPKSMHGILRPTFFSIIIIITII